MLSLPPANLFWGSAVGLTLRRRRLFAASCLGELGAGMLRITYKVARYKARALAAARRFATYSVRQKNIHRLRNLINELPDPLPFSGPDLVMGCAYDYNIETVRPFVEFSF